MILLKNCRLIPALTEGFDGPCADILVEAGAIKEIRKPGCGSPVSGETVDLRNATVLPGLFDLHSHLGCFTLHPPDMLAKSPLESAFLAYAFAMAYLRQGYTTIRDCGSNYGTAVAARNAINNGRIPGPRIFASGLIVTPTERGNETFGPLYVEADGVEAVMKACRVEFKNGADFIKYMASGAFSNEGGDPGQTITTLEELRAAVSLAETKGAYVAAHAHGADAIKLCIEAGVRTIEHASFIDDAGIRMAKDAQNCFLIPTLAVVKAALDAPPQVQEEAWGDIAAKEKATLAGIKVAYDSGLPLGWGSDIDYEHFKMKPGYEFTARKELLGFDNLELLKQATIYSARCLGLESKLGTIKENKLADLIAVDGNPDEDIYVMEKTPVLVMKEGVAETF